MIFMTFHILWEWKIIPTDELTPSFFTGVGQPPTRLSLTIINHIITININHILIVYYQPMVGGSTTNQSWFMGWSAGGDDGWIAHMVNPRLTGLCGTGWGSQLPGNSEGWIIRNMGKGCFFDVFCSLIKLGYQRHNWWFMVIWTDKNWILLVQYDLYQFHFDHIIYSILYLLLY